MSAVWIAMKKTLNCKSDTSEVHIPKPQKRKNRNRNSCCKTRLKDVKNNDQIMLKQKRGPNCSPLSIRSSDLINPFTNNVRVMSKYNGGGSSPYVAAVSPGSRVTHYFNGGFEAFPRISDGSRMNWANGSSSVGGSFRAFTCHKCGEPLTRKDSEEHILSNHAVSEVLQRDTSRKIIEMIIRAGWTSSVNRVRIERILKVHNPQTKVAQFEEYREMVKIRANRLTHTKKHPRCLADGNELLRFFGTTLSCPLGQNGSSILCTLDSCKVCCILRHGFSSIIRMEGQTQSVFGIFTTSTSEKAYRSIEIEGEERRALIVCRVIAGRVHKPMVAENLEGLGCGRRSGFDSLAGKLGYNSSHIEELYLLNPTSLLPCFVIVCK